LVVGSLQIMRMQAKKSFAVIDYKRCDPRSCNPDEGICLAAEACSNKVMKQIDGIFEQPIIFQDMCMGCWDCIEACPLKVVSAKHVT
jgi:translation initiation factor RLI1